MKRKKLLKYLARLLDGKERKRRKHRDELELLLEKLEKKQTDLEERLQTENNQQKQNRLEKEIRIIGIQREKGGKALRALEA